MPDTLRHSLLALLVIGLIGTGTELILLEHTEEFWQWAPIALIGIALVSVPMVIWWQKAASVHLFRGIMALMIISAAVGIWQHYGGNAEFELEMYPSRAGWELFWESMKGATPALAPGMMLHLGLVGLAFTFRHPALSDGRPHKELDA